MSQDTKSSITREQCRAARALLGWTQDDLEAASRVTKKTIADFERGARHPHPRTLADLKAALEAAGTIFVGRDVAGAGVRLTGRHQLLLDLRNLGRRADLRGVVASAATVLVQGYELMMRQRFSDVADAERATPMKEEWVAIQALLEAAAASPMDAEHAVVLKAAGETVAGFISPRRRPKATLPE